MKNAIAKNCVSGIIFLIACSPLYGQQLDSLMGGSINVWKAINTSVVPASLNSKVNSPYVEKGPMLTKDGKRLYFSRDGHPDNIGGVDDEDIWFSAFDDDSQSWTDAVNIGEPLNNAGPNFLCGVGWNGDSVLLGNVYSKKGKMKSGISISIKSGNVWSFPSPLYVSNDYNLSDKVCYDLSHDRSALIIAEQKTDSYGKLDLYVAFRVQKGKNSYVGTESINLGPVVNSFGNETSPFLAYDGKTLYFSSDGHNGYGKLDVFVSKRLDDTWTNWSKPENLGPGINTFYDDSDFGFTPNDRFAYYSRGITPSNSDIFRVDMTHLFNEHHTPLDQLKPDENPANIGQTKVVANVFTGDSQTINPGALPDLDYIAAYLKKYLEMNIQVGAHCGKHATRQESQQLSRDRAAKVVDYLVKRGIDKKRLTVVGFGHDLLSTSQVAGGEDVASSVEFRYTGVGKSQ